MHWSSFQLSQPNANPLTSTILSLEWEYTTTVGVDSNLENNYPKKHEQLSIRKKFSKTALSPCSKPGIIQIPALWQSGSTSLQRLHSIKCTSTKVGGTLSWNCIPYWNAFMHEQILQSLLKSWSWWSTQTNGLAPQASDLSVNQEWSRCTGHLHTTLAQESDSKCTHALKRIVVQPGLRHKFPKDEVIEPSGFAKGWNLFWRLLAKTSFLWMSLKWSRETQEKGHARQTAELKQVGQIQGWAEIDQLTQDFCSGEL